MNSVQFLTMWVHFIAVGEYLLAEYQAIVQTEKLDEMEVLYMYVATGLNVRFIFDPLSLGVATGGKPTHFYITDTEEQVHCCLT